MFLILSFSVPSNGFLMPPPDFIIGSALPTFASCMQDHLVRCSFVSAFSGSFFKMCPWRWVDRSLHQYKVCGFSNSYFLFSPTEEAPVLSPSSVYLAELGALCFLCCSLSLTYLFSASFPTQQLCHRLSPSLTLWSSSQMSLCCFVHAWFIGLSVEVRTWLLHFFDTITMIEKLVMCLPFSWCFFVCLNSFCVNIL